MHNKNLVKQKVDNKPKDSCQIVYITALILGTGTLLGYNLLISCLDYFSVVLPNYSSINFLLLPVYSLPDLIMLIFLIFFGRKFSFTFKIISSFILVGLSLGILPFIIDLFSEEIGFISALIVTGIVGITTASVQASVIGYFNYMPTRFTIANISGQAIAGILSGILRILTKLFEPKTDDGKVIGGKIYFGIGALFCIICIISYIYGNNTTYVSYYMYLNGSKKTNINPNNGELPEDITKFEAENIMNAITDTDDITEIERNFENHYRTIDDDKEQTNTSLTTPSIQLDPRINYTNQVNYNGTVSSVHISYWNVMYKVSPIALSVFLCYFTTFLIFPGLIVGLNSQYSIIQDNDWYPVLTVLTFNIFDYIGRQFITNITTFGMNSNNIWIGCAIRLLLHPLFIAYYLSWINYKDWMIYISTAILGITNGHFCCLCFQWQPSMVKSDEQEIAAAIMSLALVTGITSGSYVALGLSQML